MGPLLYVIAIPLITAVAGYWVAGSRRMVYGWVIFLVMTMIIQWLLRDAHAIARMFGLVATMYAGMNVIASISSDDAGRRLSLGQWLAFVFGWAGMRAEIFRSLGRYSPHAGAWKKILTGMSCIVAGILLLLLMRMSIHVQANGVILFVAGSAILLIGLSLILHFGILTVMAGFWRLFGVPAYPLFNTPWRARTLGDFWSRRWNVGFSEMTAFAVYRPLQSSLPRRAAVMAGFLFSGVLHELAISLPVYKGYGLPMLYFVIQAVAVHLETTLLRSGRFPSNRLARTIWVFSWVILPVPLLFHPPFMRAVIWPLAGIVAP